MTAATPPGELVVVLPLRRALEVPVPVGRMPLIELPVNSNPWLRLLNT